MKRDPIPVGNLSPFSGGLGWIGPTTRRGIETALHESGGINDAGVFGREIEIRERDTETSVITAIEQFDALANGGVPAVVGPTSTPAQSLVDPAREKKLPYVSPIAGTTQLDEVGGEYVWRTVPSDSVGARAQAKYASEERDAGRMGLVYKDDKGSKSFSGTAGVCFERLGGTVVEELALPESGTSYRRQVDRLADSAVEAISMTAGTNVSARFLSEQDENAPGPEFDILLGNDVVHDQFVETVGAEVMNGLFGQKPAAGPAYEEFATRFEEIHGREPAGFAASAYDAMNLIALAFVREGEVSRRAVPDNLRAIGSPGGTRVSTFADGKAALETGEGINYVGAANRQNFDSSGDPQGSFMILEVVDGEWIERKRYAASELGGELS